MTSNECSIASYEKLPSAEYCENLVVDKQTTCKECRYDTAVSGGLSPTTWTNGRHIHNAHKPNTQPKSSAQNDLSKSTHQFFQEVRTLAADDKNHSKSIEQCQQEQTFLWNSDYSSDKKENNPKLENNQSVYRSNGSASYYVRESFCSKCGGTTGGTTSRWVNGNSCSSKWVGDSDQTEKLLGGRSDNTAGSRHGVGWCVRFCGASMNACRRLLLPRAGATPRRALLFITLISIVFGLLLYKLGLLCIDDYRSGNHAEMMPNEKYVVGSDKKVYMYNRQMPLIFIGGVPRSGTTLMRAMLDAHPDVRCGQETRVIPRLLQMRAHWMKSEKESVRLVEAGITKDVLDAAIASFCLEIIARHGEAAPRLCNKDPLTIKMGTYVIDLFPNAKFIFMVRDGRATTHSIISRKVTITGFDLTSYRQCLTKWNQAVETMHGQCGALGPTRCLRVPYEQLVLHPRTWMTRVLKFLDVPWNESVLHHEQFINKGIELSKVERSSDQVIKPINLEALTKWVGHIPSDVVRDMADIAPMLSVFGYDPYANPPNYGKPDMQVADNTRLVRSNQLLWEQKAKALLKPSNQFEETMIEEIASDVPVEVGAS